MVYSALFHMHLWANGITEWNPSTAKIALNVVKGESERHSVMSDSLRSHGLYSPWNSPGQNTGDGSHSLLQGILPTQGSNPGLPHCRWILYQLSHKGSTRILEWVVYPFSRRSSQPRNQIRVSCIAGHSLSTELWGKPLHCQVGIMQGMIFSVLLHMHWKEHVFCCFEVMYSMKTDWVTFVYRVSPDFSFIVIFLSTCSIN